MAQGGNTTVTAIVKDPNGNLYTNSQVNITFVEPTTIGKIPLLNGSVFQKSYTINKTDSFGRFTISLPDTGVIDNSSGTSLSQWSFRVIFNDGVTSFVYVTPINCSANTPVTCNSGSMDITTPLQAAAALIPGSFASNNLVGPGSITGAFSGTHSLTGQVNFGPGLGGVYNNCSVQGKSSCVEVSNSINFINNADQKVSLQNTDFEASLAIPPPGWDNLDFTVVSYETGSPAPNKAQSLKIVSSFAGGGLQSSQNYSVRPNDTYILKCYVKSDGVHNAQAALVWLDKNGVTTIHGANECQTTSAAWTFVTVQDFAPSNAVSMYVSLFTSGNGSSAWFDEISVIYTPAIQTTYYKVGSGAGSYSAFNTTYANVDTTNLCQVVTVPTGWKLIISAAGSAGSNNAAVSVQFSLSDIGTTCGGGGVTPLIATAILPSTFNTVTSPFNLQHVLNGDGNAHAISLQALTSNVADSWTLLNVNAGKLLPTMILTLVPSN